MDYNMEDTNGKRKTPRRFIRIIQGIFYIIIFIMFTTIFIGFCYHLMTVLIGVESFSEMISWQNPPVRSEYEEYVHQLVMNSKDPNHLRFQESRTNPKPPSTVKKNHFEETKDRILARYEYNQIHRPKLVPTPPNERNLPWDNLYNVLNEWNPDNPEIPENFQERLQHFNYGDPYERSLAEAYRNAEIPFKLYNVSEFNEISFKWDEKYLESSISNMKTVGHVEKSKDNHFMFWRSVNKRLKNYEPPTEIIHNVNFPKYLKIAKQADIEKWNTSKEHYYFMLGVPPHDHHYFIGKDLTSFSTTKANFFITNPTANKGIQCRFGMRGVIAECHYDSGKNMVAMLHGQKRYIITPPWSCPYLGIIADPKHPSYRHSIIDWSDLNQAKANKFEKADAIDTVLHVGEVLYIPSFWFHYIVSLEYSIQCNSRSGFPPGRKGYNYIQQCFSNQ